MPPTEAKSNQAPNSGLFESGGSRGYTAGGPLSEKWSEIFPQEQGRRGLRLDDKSWTSYLRCVCINASCFMPWPCRMKCAVEHTVRQVQKSTLLKCTQHGRLFLSGQHFWRSLNQTLTSPKDMMFFTTFTVPDATLTMPVITPTGEWSWYCFMDPMQSLRALQPG